MKCISHKSHGSILEKTISFEGLSWKRMSDLLRHAFLSWSWPVIWAISFVYFLVLYFGIGQLFLMVCLKLEKAGLAEKIDKQAPGPEQIRSEKKHSFVSIVIFGFSSWPVVWLYRNGFYQPQTDSFYSVLTGLLLLNIWNEIHFFLVHRLMHIPFFMKNVHLIHHRSRIPTVWSVYSFHWLEAALLSTVPLFFCLVMSPPLMAVAFYPFNSILFNFAGHCNHRLLFLKSEGGLATRHVVHHQRSNGNFGFASGLPDKILLQVKKLKKSI